MKLLFSVLIFAFICASGGRSFAAPPEIRFNFEDGEKGGWEIPDWALEQDDHVGRTTETVQGTSSGGGTKSLAVMCDFPGTKWAAAVVGIQKNMDLKRYKAISAAIFLPQKARSNLFQARIIITAGPWVRFEMRKATPLTPGKWVTLSGSFTDDNVWRSNTRDVVLSNYIDQVKKIDIRIEYNVDPKRGGPEYKGPVYADDIVIK